MRRAALGLYTYLEFFVSILLFIPAMGVVTLLVKDDPGRRIRGRWMRRFGRFTYRLTPIWKFTVEGAPPADVKHTGYVVVSNHQSTSDPFLLCWLPLDMRFVAKEELFKLPLIGWLMKLSGDIPLRRGDKSSVVAMKDACVATLRSGMSVMLFPEGTRSPDGALLPFKDGAFQIAVEAQAPILPVALEGTRACRPKGSMWFGEARASVRMLEPIPTAGLTLEDVPTLKERTREVIAAALAEKVGSVQPGPADPGRSTRGSGLPNAIDA